MTDEEFGELCCKVSYFIKSKRMSAYGRFLRYEYAKELYSYFKNLENIKLVGLCTYKYCADILADDSCYKSLVFVENGKFLGNIVRRNRRQQRILV